MSERISWRKVAWVGLLGALFVGACSVGDGDGIDDDDDGGASSGGSSGKGGTSSSGGKGGTGGSGGKGGTAGTTSAGGTGSGGEPTNGGEGGSGNAGSETTPLCDMVSAGGAGSEDPVGTPQDDCEPAADEDACGKCVKETCCDEWNNCGGYEPYNVCGWGGPEGTGEFNCVLKCLQDIFATEELITEDDQFACADECVTTSDVNGMNCGQIGDETSALLGCVLDANNFDCQVSCGLAQE